MSLLSKPIAQIDYCDVDQFCSQKLPESQWLDYKAELDQGKDANEKLAKLFSAFANAHGGVIIFGVSQVPGSSPGEPDKCDGMPVVKNMANRIQQICQSSIYPPISPQVSSPISVPGSANVILVVRISESEAAPHRTGDGRVYVRVNDIKAIKDDGKDATGQELEWLVNRRAKSVAVRESLTDRAKRRAGDVFSAYDRLPLVSISTVPLYPSSEIITTDVLFAYASQLKNTPAFEEFNPLTMHQTVCGMFPRRFCSEQEGSKTYCEFTTHGSVFYQVAIADRARKFGMTPGIEFYFHPVYVLAFVNILCETATKLYARIPGVSLLQLSITAQNIERAQPIFTADGQGNRPILDGRFSIERVLLAEELSSRDTLASIYREFVVACNLADYQKIDSVVEVDLDQWFLKLQRASVRHGATAPDVKS